MKDVFYIKFIIEILFMYYIDNNGIDKFVFLDNDKIEFLNIYFSLIFNLDNNNKDLFIL